VTEQNSPE